MSTAIEYGMQTIKEELASLQVLPTYINSSFSDCVNYILNNHSRLVITGIGKSAIIGQKIVATLNSTGQSAVFMHAADAIHGDLGIIQQNDAIVCISKSGNTPEIKVLLPLLKQAGNKLIAIVGNTESALALTADFVLNTSVDKEACPNNLAPTTSTTAQLLMGDALAVALLKMRNFTAEDFGKFHPGGALGKKLYMRCGDIAKMHAAPQVLDSDKTSTFLHEISEKRMGATAVTNVNKEIVGIITDGDVRRMIEKFTDLKSIVAKDVMSSNPICLQADTMATEAAKIALEKKITQIIVLDQKKYIGMIHLHDLNREGIL